MSSSDLVDALAANESAKRLALASFVLYCYDWVITSDEEIRFIWSRGMSASKLLFIINRWIVPPFYLLHLITMFTLNPSRTLCGLAVYRPLISFTVISIAELVMALRIWTLYEKSRWSLYFLSTCFAISRMVAFTAIGLAMAASKIQASPLPKHMTGCFIARIPLMFLPFACLLVLETIHFTMMVIKAFEVRRRARTPLITVIVRDGAMWYLVTLATMLPVVISMPFQRAQFIVLSSDYIVISFSASVSRLILSLHGLFLRTDISELSTFRRPKPPRPWRSSMRDSGLNLIGDSYSEFDGHEKSDETTRQTNFETSMGVSPEWHFSDAHRRERESQVTVMVERDLESGRGPMMPVIPVPQVAQLPGWNPRRQNPDGYQRNAKF